MRKYFHGEQCSVPACDQPAVALCWPDDPLRWFYVCEVHEDLAPITRKEAERWLPTQPK